jgi:hypothetical protein
MSEGANDRSVYMVAELDANGNVVLAYTFQNGCSTTGSTLQFYYAEATYHYGDTAGSLHHFQRLQGRLGHRRVRGMRIADLSSRSFPFAIQCL